MARFRPVRMLLFCAGVLALAPSLVACGGGGGGSWVKTGVRLTTYQGILCTENIVGSRRYGF